MPQPRFVQQAARHYLYEAYVRFVRGFSSTVGK